MRGLHCVADLQGCNINKLTAPAPLLAFALKCVADCGLEAVAQQSHSFPPSPISNQLGGGITLTVLLAESHVCIHTWPEFLGVTLDVYVCNFEHDNSEKARQLITQLITWFEPQQIHQQNLERGI
jgi:S-adenosylmethionine decarboxylase